MPDTAGHSALPSDDDGRRHTLSLAEVEEQLLAAGVPRSRRHVQRMCASGMLDASKRPGPSGDEYFVAAASLPKAIGDLKAMQERRDRQSALQRAMSDRDAPRLPLTMSPDMVSHGAPRPAMSDAGAAEKFNQSESDAVRPSTPEPAMSDPLASKYVTQLERDNEFLRGQVTKKDEQISNLSERPSETQKLFAGVQRMLAPLLGQADPYRKPDTTYGAPEMAGE